MLIFFLFFKHFFVNLVLLTNDKRRKFTDSSAFEFQKILFFKAMVSFQPIAPIGPQT